MPEIAISTTNPTFLPKYLFTWKIFHYITTQKPSFQCQQENLVVSRTITCWHWDIHIFTCKKNKPELVRRFLSIRIWRRTASSWVFYNLVVIKYPRIQLSFQNTYSDQIFCRFRTGWISLFAFCTKKREKTIINENNETLNFSVLYGKL